MKPVGGPEGLGAPTAVKENAPLHASRAYEGSAASPQSYIPMEVIGQGSFGVVLHAKIAETGEDVAIKRVLYDRRMHSRELNLMRDVLGDARREDNSSRERLPDDAPPAQSHSRVSGGQSSTIGSPASPSTASQSSLSFTNSPDSGSFGRGDFFTAALRRDGTKRAPVVLLRRHPNIVQLRHYYFSSDSKTGENYLHLVMSYLPTDMQTLKRQYFQRLAQRYTHTDTADASSDSTRIDQCNEVVDPSTALFPLIVTKVFLFQLCRAIAFLHARNVCHRDIKPANIVIDPQSGRLQLCDFGSAKQIFNRNVEKNVSYICSRYYRAPELLFGALHYGSEVDMWSVGCIAAEFLRSAGTPLFKGSSTVDQMAEIFKVLGAPSGAEMHAMNPQTAEAMRITREEFFPAPEHANSGVETARPKDLSAADIVEREIADDVVGDTGAETAGPTRASAVTSSSPTLHSDYFHCYDILRVKAMNWGSVLHRDVPEEAADFISKLLCYIPEKRLSAAAAVEHPFFNDLFSAPPRRSAEGAMNRASAETDGKAEDYVLPRLPNGRTLPVEMFMLTELETTLYGDAFQARMNTEVQRISSRSSKTNARRA